MNQINLIGRLVADPEIRIHENGTKVSYFTIAVKRSFLNKNNEKETDFISCQLWNNLAENFCAYCKKGNKIALTGRLQTRKYDKEGKRVYVTEVVGENIEFLILNKDIHDSD